MNAAHRFEEEELGLHHELLLGLKQEEIGRQLLLCGRQMLARRLEVEVDVKRQQEIRDGIAVCVQLLKRQRGEKQKGRKAKKRGAKVIEKGKSIAKKKKQISSKSVPEKGKRKE